MSHNPISVGSLAEKLYEIGAIKFGEFKLKSGKISPIYIDLRIIPSFPSVLDYVTDAYISVIEANRIEFDKIAGVPMSSIPLAAIVSYKLKAPLLYVRKEQKSYGTMKSVEGVIVKGELVLVIDDVATTGSSILEASQKLREAGAIVKDAAVLIDRQEGARENLEKNNIKLYSFANLQEVILALRKKGLIDDDTFENVVDYLQRRD